jgi:7-cyano-7-deazaguanine reductase
MECEAMNGEWRYTGKIEDMPAEDVKARIQAAMDYEITAKIQPIPYVAGAEEVVQYLYQELSAKCPMTGLRDLYTITVRFKPDKLLPELKSLKMYFAGYDELPISHEHLAAKIYLDFQQAVQPAEFNLVLDVAVRGGIKTTVELGPPVLSGRTP